MNKKDVKIEERVEEQAPRSETIDVQIDRVAFTPVDQLEDLAHVGFCTERLTAKHFAEPLFRLCREVTRGDIDSLPTPLTPFVSAQSLVDLINGVVFLQPLVLQVVKEAQSNVELKEQ